MYSDSNCTIQYTIISSSHLENDSNAVKKHSIYWKWEYKDDSVSNANDNLYKDKDLTIPITVKFSQIEGGC